MLKFTNSITCKNVKHECMQFIAIDSHRAFKYARIILKKRWADIGKPEVEDLIGTNAKWAYQYAYKILNKRWADIGKPEVEDAIKQNGYCWVLYIDLFE